MTTEYLMQREMEHVLAALTPANALIAQVCVRTGLRVGDVLALRTADLRPQMWITEAKTGKRKRCNLSAALLARLKAQAGRVWVFENARDPRKHRTRQAVWADIKRAAKAFRLPQNVAVHSLRKLYAVQELDKAGGDADRVRRHLNHADVATTLIYAMSYQLYAARYPERAAAEQARHAEAARNLALTATDGARVYRETGKGRRKAPAPRKTRHSAK